MSEMAEHISRDQAAELVQQCDHGVLITADLEPVPVIGHLPEDEHDLRAVVETFEFGDENIDIDLNQ